MDADFEVLCSGLRFPEGPIARPDGSVLFVEIERGTLTRWHPQTGTRIVAELGGGPNGAAIGPDGKVYVCNNGGCVWHERDGQLIPGVQAHNYETGSIQRVDLNTGAVETLYTGTDGLALSGPNDIVFDRQGGFWFTDLGKSRKTTKDHGGLYYALPDGSSIKRAVYPLDTPNGVGLSADEKTLYVAQTSPRVLLSFDIAAPGELAAQTGFMPGTPVGAQQPGHLLDSLAVQSDGKICVGTLLNGGISIFDPRAGLTDFFALPSMMATNICFGGADLKTAYITCSTTGELIAARWPVAGLPLNFYDA